MAEKITGILWGRYKTILKSNIYNELISQVSLFHQKIKYLFVSVGDIFGVNQAGKTVAVPTGDISCGGMMAIPQPIKSPLQRHFYQTVPIGYPDGPAIQHLTMQTICIKIRPANGRC